MTRHTLFANAHVGAIYIWTGLELYTGNSAFVVNEWTLLHAAASVRVEEGAHLALVQKHTLVPLDTTTLRVEELANALWYLRDFFPIVITVIKN